MAMDQNRKGKTLAAAFSKIMEKPGKGSGSSVPILMVSTARTWDLPAYSIWASESSSSSMCRARSVQQNRTPRKRRS